MNQFGNQSTQFLNKVRATLQATSRWAGHFLQDSDLDHVAESIDHYHGRSNASRCPARDDVDVVDPVHQRGSATLGTRRQLGYYPAR